LSWRNRNLFPLSPNYMARIKSSGVTNGYRDITVYHEKHTEFDPTHANILR